MNRILILFVWAVLPAIAVSDEQKNFDKWKELSAQTQNLHYRLSMLGPNTGADPSIYEDALKGVDKALNDLVAVGELESRRISLIPAGEFKDDSLDRLFQGIEPLSKEHGFFVASEMCDLGARLRFMVIKPEESVELHLRLPEKDLAKFLSHIDDLGILKSGVEQDGAEQPATAPGLKPEGKEKPKPESEVRSQ